MIPKDWQFLGGSWGGGELVGVEVMTEFCLGGV